MSAWQAWCLSVALPSLVPKHRSTSIRVGRESTLAVGSALGLEAWSSVQSVQGLAGNARRRPALRLGNPLRQRLYACHLFSAGSRPCGLANVCRAPGILCPVKLGLHCSPGGAGSCCTSSTIAADSRHLSSWDWRATQGKVRCGLWASWARQETGALTCWHGRFSCSWSSRQELGYW